MSKIFLTFLFSATCFASPRDLVRLTHLKKEYQNIQYSISTQNFRSQIEFRKRLKFLWVRAEFQARACSTQWSMLEAVARVRTLQGNFSSEQEHDELESLVEQLDEAGCCALLPESNWYRTHD